MKACMHAEPHGPTMRRLLHWCDEAALVHWTQADTDFLPERRRISEFSRRGGRRTVNHPSAAHTAQVIPAPRASQTRELRFK